MDMAGASPWSEQQLSWLQGMGYTVYVDAQAVEAAVPLAPAEPAAGVPMETLAPRRSEAPATPPRRAPAPAPEPELAVAPARARPGGRRTSVGLPDRLQIALLRASGLNPSDPQTQSIMEGWRLDELRGNPAAKRALWPQLRALRRARRR
jgi:hypothetical protein